MILAGGAPGFAESEKSGAKGPTYSPEGVVHVPAFDLPPSPYMSKEAADLLKMRAMMQDAHFRPQSDIAELRRKTDASLAPFIKMMKARYPVDMVEQQIAGVKTRVFTPKGGAFDRKRVLVNLHGGAFSVCAEACALLESIPISSLGGYKVVSVDYRMAPEHVFPAASEDVAAVYRELLKSYKPKQIGIYGCSAGGNLTGQAMAWFSRNALPLPGAIGIFGAGAGRFGTGDSAHIAAYVDGGFPPPPPAGTTPPPPPYRNYFDGADMKNPLISPVLHPEVLAKFPPTLLITGTRAHDLSPAVYTNSQLIKAGVKSTLIVGEAMGHCYIYLPQFPESQDAYEATVNFFKANL